MYETISERQYPPDYRASEVRQIMGWIKSGQCGCLIGIPGTGKSNFLQALLNQKLQSKYLGRDYPKFIFVYINLLELVEQSSWAIYELILRRLATQISDLGIADPNIESGFAMQQETLQQRNPVATQRAIEYYLAFVLKTTDRRLVILFDEFNTVFAVAEPSLLKSLRAIRDLYKSRLIYIVAGITDLSELRTDLPQVDHFYRLVSRRVCGLGPYSKADAQLTVDYLAQQLSLTLTPENRTRLIGLCGGHAGLLKTAIGVLEGESQQLTPVTLSQILANAPAIQQDCQRIWNKLQESEQVAVRALASGSTVNSRLMAQLQLKGLVTQDSSARIFSPLMAEFARRQTSSPAKGFFVDYATGNVYIEKQLKANLNGLELETLYYLYRNQGRVCTKDEIIENIHPQRSRDGSTDESLQALISRVRKKIEPDPGPPHYLLTVRGEGYKLVSPPEELANE